MQKDTPEDAYSPKIMTNMFVSWTTYEIRQKIEGTPKEFRCSW